jgi:hypothetical protein
MLSICFPYAFHLVLFPDVGPPTPRFSLDHPSGSATTHLASEEGVATGVAWLMGQAKHAKNPLGILLDRELRMFCRVLPETGSHRACKIDEDSSRKRNFTCLCYDFCLS